MLFLQRCFDRSDFFFKIQRCGAQALNSFHRGVVGNAAYLWRGWGHWGWHISIDVNSFPWHPDEPYLQNLKVFLCVPLEIGIQMSLPVEVKPVLWCIISQLQTLVWEGHTFINGTMIDATWSTILSASMAQVGETKVIFLRWDALLEKQLPFVSWGNLQMSCGHTFRPACGTDSFGVWVSELTLTRDVLYQI